MAYEMNQLLEVMSESGASDLHIHVGGAAAPHTLWSIAHEQGLKLPVADYWEFRELVSARPGKVKSLDEYLAGYSAAGGRAAPAGSGALGAVHGPGD